jgi:hypothetical protein
MPPIPEQLTVLEWIAIFLAISLVGFLGYTLKNIPRSLERAATHVSDTAREERTQMLAAFERRSDAQIKAFREDAAAQRAHDSERTAGLHERLAEIRDDTNTLVARSQ